MLTIDGSDLEGGGQIVRTAVALSAITRTPVTIHTIRAGRDRPGLAAQHIAAVQAVAKICHARCEGLSTGSNRIIFTPDDPVRGDIHIDIGTAGSIPLVIQAWLPVALHVGGSITISGGTEVENSPTIDYVQHLQMNFLKQTGADLDMTIVNRGYYPKGGGLVRVTVEKPVNLMIFHPETPGISGLHIFSCSSHLPPHVTERQAESAKGHLGESSEVIHIQKDVRQGPGIGSSVTLVCGWKGSSAIGRRGMSAEIVGEIAAGRLLDELKKNGAVDVHLADQLLIYLAQYGGSFVATGCSLHARSVCSVLARFGFRVNVEQRRGVVFSS